MLDLRFGALGSGFGFCRVESCGLDLKVEGLGTSHDNKW